MPFKSISAVVASSNNVSNPTTLTPVLPTRATGDLLLAITSCRSITATVATPAGWTIWPGFPQRSATASGGSIYVFYKEVVGGEGNPALVWTGVATTTTGDSSQACVLCLDNANVASPYDNTTVKTDASAAGPTIPSITTTTDDTTVVGIGMKVIDTATTGTVAGGYTERGDFHTTTGTGHHLYVATQEKAVTGSIGAIPITESPTTAARCLAEAISVKKRVPVTYYGVVARATTFGATTAGAIAALDPTEDADDAYSTAVKAEASLVSYYRLSEPAGTTPKVLDYAGTWDGLAQGTAREAASLLAAMPGNDATLADGIDDVIEFATGTEQALDGAHTIEFWMKMAQPATGFPNPLGCGGGYDVGTGWTFYTLPSNRLFYKRDNVSFGPATWTLDGAAAHHYAVTYNDATGALRIFKDGVRLEETTGVGFLACGINPYLTIFRDTYAANYAACTIDELALYSSALPDATILSHYQLGSGTGGATTHYGATSSAYTLGAATAGQRRTTGVVARATSFGAVTAGRRRTTSTVTAQTAFASTTQGRRRTTGAIAAPTTFGAVVAGQSSTPGPPGAYFDTVMADTPISYWRLGAGTTIHDEMGVSPDVTATGGVSTTGLLTGDANAAVAFDGVDDAVSFPNAPEHAITVGSLEVWMQAPSPGAGHRGMLVKPLAYGLFLYDYELQSYDWAGGGFKPSGVYLNDGVRHHVVMTFQSGVAGGSRFYVDGVAVGSPFLYTVSAQYESTCIAHNASSQFFGGVLDEAAIYGYALTPAQIAEHHQAGLTGTAPVTTHYGASSLQVSFAAATAGRRRTTSATSFSTAFAATTAGQRKAFGAVAMPVGFAAVIQGRRRTTSAVAVAAMFGAVTQARRRTTSAVAVAATFGAVTQARRRTFGGVALPATVAIATAGQRRTFGVVARPATFAAAVQARRTTFGSTVRPVLFDAVTAGLRIAEGLYGNVVANYTFGATTQARRQTFGSVARPTTFASATAAQRRTFGVVARPITVALFTSGQSTVGAQTRYGQVTMPVTLVQVVQGRRRTFGGVIGIPLNLGAVTQARRRTTSAIAVPVSLAVVTAGQRRTFGAVARPTSLAVVTQGRRQTLGVVAMPVTLATFTRGQRRAFAVVSLPITAEIFSGGRATVFAVTDLSILALITTAGRIRSPSVVISDADALYLSGQPADEVDVGAEQVWPSVV